LRFALFPLEKCHPFCVPSVIELGKFNGYAPADPAAAHLDVGDVYAALVHAPQLGRDILVAASAIELLLTQFAHDRTNRGNIFDAFEVASLI
jgi:hypothetical protein